MDHKPENWIAGVVVPGDGRGRKLGFPTANLRLLKESQRPADGIYACKVKIQGGEKHVFQGVMHVGPRPTIEGASPSVEIHLLGVSHMDLYGKKLWFSPVKFLRNVKKFNSLDELTQAIRQDAHDALLFLKETLPFL